MNRRTAILRLVIFFLTTASLAQAQQPKSLPLMGYLSAGDPATESIRSEGIRQALRERSYIKGQNIAIEYRYAEGNRDRFPKLAAELVRIKVDIIVVAGGGGLTMAVMNATKAIPIVMVGGGVDPIAAGFVESLARPGGNVTGITNLTGVLGGKRLELLKEAVPKLARVAFLYDPAALATPASVREVKEVLPAAARGMGLTLQPWEVRSADDFDKVFAAMGKQRPDGLYVSGAGSVSVLLASRKRIADFAFKEPVTVNVRQEGRCRGWWAIVLWGGPSGELPARRILRGQNPEGSQARRSAGGAADEVRFRRQSSDR
jgi:putative ABC transport system substrate-binding protein